MLLKCVCVCVCVCVRACVCYEIMDAQLFYTSFTAFSVISWRPVSLVSKTRLYMEKTPISNLSHNVVSGTPYHERDSNSVIFTDCTDSCKFNYHAIKTTTTPLILIKFKLTSVVLSNIPTENIWTESDDYWLNTRNRISAIFMISTN